MNRTAALSKRSPLVGGANRLLPALYASGALCRHELDGEAIMAGLVRETGLSDFGDDWFRQPLEVLIAALRDEAALNPLGHLGAVGQIRKVLKDRLHAEHLFLQNPQINARSLARPVIVVGPMRSGTTRLHRLLAADPRFAHLRAFETINPVPTPDFRPEDRDWRWVQARLVRGAVRRFNPATAAIHPSGAFEPEEELGLLVRSIWSMKLEVQWQVPGYARWAERQDATPAYRYMARLLRLIGWARDEDDSRPWVLKTPQHMLDLPALLRVFPDARIVFIHRDPTAVVGSSCSLVWNQMIIHSDRTCPREIGREWLRKTELQIARMRRARLAIASDRRIDVHYGDMERDWQGVMRRIYAFLDMDIEPALPAMAQYMARSDERLHRNPHRYSLQAFGLQAGEVSERFASYSQAFGLPLTASAPQCEEADAEPAIALGTKQELPVDWSELAPARLAARRR